MHLEFAEQNTERRIGSDPGSAVEAVLGRLRAEKPTSAKSSASSARSWLTRAVTSSESVPVISSSFSAAS
jgi:hypothetical protein